MCMRFRNSSHRSGFKGDISLEPGDADVKHFSETCANTGVFDDRDQRANYLLEGNQSEYARCVAGGGNRLAVSAHR
jgi:hypothetical protein